MADTVDEAQAAVQALLNDGSEAVTVVYPANAAALHKGPQGLLLSAAVAFTCDGCGQTVPFDGRRVEGYFRPGGLVVEAEWDRQHGCGTWAPMTESIWWEIGTPFDPRALVATLRSLVVASQAERNASTDVPGGH
jgi:hypothetical protein